VKDTNWELLDGSFSRETGLVASNRTIKISASIVAPSVWSKCNIRQQQNILSAYFKVWSACKIDPRKLDHPRCASVSKFRPQPKFFNLANPEEKRLLAPKNDYLLGDLRARSLLGRPLLHYDSDGRLRCHIAATI
jgi:hypothetical protein